MPNRPFKNFVICVQNGGYPASLERRKIYVALRDLNAEKHGQLRVIDESGEDDLYQKNYFARLQCQTPSRRLC